MAARRICVYASEVASLIGVNPYRARADALHAVMSRHGLRNSAPTEQVRVEHAAEAVLRAMPEVVERARTAPTGRAAATAVPSLPKIAEMASKLGETGPPARRLSTSPAPICPVELQRAMEGKLVCEVGKARETADMDRHGASEASRRQTSFSKQMRSEGGNPYVLWGRTDAVAEETVDEYKNRKNRVFGHIPAYELPQLYAYMHLTGIRRARQIETHGDDQLVHEIRFRPELWGWYKGELDRAVDEMLALDAASGEEMEL